MISDHPSGRGYGMETATAELTVPRGRYGDERRRSHARQACRLQQPLPDVEHGLISKGQYFVPTSAVNACAEGTVYLNVGKDEVTHAGWDTPPPVATDAGNPPLGQP
mgnify:CR=1 FL=1